MARLQAGARAAALFAAAVGVLVLVGWLLDARLLMQVLPGQVAMVPSTAIGFILAGLALGWRAGAETRSRLLASRVAAAASGLLGFLALAEYFSGLSFGIDELLFQDRVGLTGVFPGRMAVLAAISFVAIGVSLLLSNMRRAWWAAEALALVPGLLSLASLAGYAYGMHSIDWIGKYKGMAIHTAAAFLVLSLGVLLCRGDRGFARLMVSETVGGRVARRILPVALGVPLVLGWLHLVGQRAGLYSTEFGTALYAVSNAVVLLAIFWAIVAALMRTDQERGRAEEALVGSELRSRNLAAIVEFSDDAIIGKALDGTITTWNVGAERLYGWPSSEAIGQPVGFHIPPDRRDDMRVIMAKIRRGESIEQLETVRLRKNRDPIEVSLTVSPIRGAAGEVAGASSIARDITQRKRSEDSLRKAEEQYRLLFENSPHPMWVVDRETLRYLAVNDAAVEHYGYSRDEFLSMDIGQIRPAEDVAAVLEAIPKEKAGLEKMGIWKHVKKDGTLISVEIATHALTFSGRSAWLVLAYDVTDRLQAEESLRESEQRYRSLFESMLHGYAYCEMLFEDGEPRDFVYLDVNTTFEKVTGLTGVVGKRITQVIPGIQESHPELFEIYGRVARTGAPEKFEIFLDALGKWFSISAYSPQKGRFVALFDDITERKRVEESLQKLQLAVEQSESVVFMTDPEGAITYVNPAFERVYGYSREETLGKTPRILKGGGRDQAYYQRLWQGLLAGKSVREEFVNKRRDGKLVPVEASVSPVMDARGGRIGFIAVQHDLTERKRSEERIRISEEKYRLLFDSNPLPTWVFDNETLAFLAVNQAARDHYGYSLDEFLSMTIKDIRPPEDVPSLLGGIGLEGPGFQKSGIWRHRKKDGTLIHAEVTSAPFVFEGRAAQLVLAIDVTDRLRAEEGMRRSEERFRRLFDSNTIGISVAELSGNVLESNDAYLAMIGYTREELLSGVVRWDGITPAEYREKDQIAVEQLQRTGVAQPYEKALIRKDGTHVPLLIGIAMLEASERSIIAYTVDLSSRRQLEEQFRQAQKMEAVGQLAGGVAHDFNNLLTVILGYSDLLAGRLKPGSVESEELDEIRKAGERAASLTRQLLAFSRQQVLERMVLDVNDLITDIEKMLRRLIGEDVELVTVLDPALHRVFADAGQLEQVIMNLAVNARDAMPRGGRLTIETANVELDEAYARLHATVRPGSYVMIAVSDTGVGMNGETLACIFEPFFTTKGLGKGTGLGLATVYGIIKQSGGYVWVYSEVGKGTTFKIYLPLVEEGGEAEPVPAAEPDALHGSETVLLVEDEQSVRTLSRSILEGYGYTVLEAASGKEGLEVARNYPLPIHLVLTDVVMPEMGGSDMASRLEALRPGVRVLYMSGYTDDAVFRHGLLEKGRVFLQKPFTPGTLARKVREVLGG
jgi:PAS domain S-box-containing protein